jgi:hypothetical protein
MSQPIKEQTTMSKFTTTVAIAAVSMALTAQASSAAEIWLEYHPQTPTIYIKGDIERGDYEVFKRVALSDKRLRKGRVYVALGSHGGSTFDGLNIGQFIRDNQMKTVAVRDCMSACAYIWVAGVGRAVFDNANVGFHGSFVTRKNDNNAYADNVGNAQVGIYLSRLGLKLDAISWMVERHADELAYLTLAIGKQYNITYTVLPSAPQGYTGNVPSKPKGDTWCPTCSSDGQSLPPSKRGG